MIISNEQRGARQVGRNTKLFVSHVPTRPLFQLTAANDQNSNGDLHHINNKARLPHRLLYSSIESSREKKTPAKAIPGQMHATGFLRGYRLHDPSRGAASTGTIFPLAFHVEKSFSIFLVHPAVSQTKNVCEIEHPSVSVLLLVPMLLAREQTMSMCPNYRPRGGGTQPLVMLLCGFFWRSNRSHYYLLLV